MIDGWTKPDRATAKKNNEKMRKIGSLPQDKDIIPTLPQLCLCVLHQWIKSWFFVLETEDEFNDSLSRFWIRLDQMKHVLPSSVREKVRHHVVNKLEPKKSFWANCLYIHHATRDQRTTSVGEAHHKSTKSGQSATAANQNIDTAATNIMKKSVDRANAKGKLNQRNNDSRLVRHDGGLSELTPHANNKSAVQLSLSKRCKAVQVSPTRFKVWNPTSPKIDPRHASHPELLAPIPSYHSVRTVSVVDGKSMHCTCGHPTQMGMPCRHILAVTGKRHARMFNVQWLSLFQRCHGRDGFDSMTETYNKILDKESSQLPSHGLNIEGKVEEFFGNSRELPFFFGTTSEEDKSQMELIEEWTRRGQPCLKGQSIRSKHDLVVFDEEECGPEDFPLHMDNEQIRGSPFSGTVCLSPQAKKLRAIDNSVSLTQEQQQTTAKTMRGGKEDFCHRMMALTSATEKLIEPNTALVDMSEEMIRGVEELYSKMFAFRTNMFSESNTKQGPQAKRSIEFALGNTGTCKQPVVARKKRRHERR